LDVLVNKKFVLLKGARVGLLCHQASVDRSLRHLMDLSSNNDVTISALFAPEHGLSGTAQDQIPIEREHSSTVGIPVFSLYGRQRIPSTQQLSSLDVLVCDLQDVGSRYYTFIWTMILAMQACATFGKRFIVLDRPNPIDGLTMEGPVLDLVFASFVGLYALPVRHGMTIGEIARWANETYNIGADLEVIPMQGWKRSMSFAETGLPWVPPSPNMPTTDTALVYPGGCLIEGTNLSEGRGTTRPFEWVGAPFIDGEALAVDLNTAQLLGVWFRPCAFEPAFHKFKGERCGGVQIHVLDPKQFKPFLCYLILIERVYQRYSKQFAWRRPPYEYEKQKLAFDILCGTDRIRRTIEAGRAVRPLEKTWGQSIEHFRQERRPFLLYNESL
jgi:uncharacterized protein YbbC (DUF1343 family)